MTSRPILFSGAMVRAILDGRKSQTRREVKWPCYSASDGAKRRIFMERDVEEMNSLIRSRAHHPTMRGFCPYGQVGDLLWVRETWREDSPDDPEGAVYKADWSSPLPPGFKWKPSIYMPRWASRITLRIADVRVERLQDISDEDCISEGIDPETNEDWAAAEHAQLGGSPTRPGTPERFAYACLWDRINGPEAWERNPWVWVIEFERAAPKPDPAVQP